MTESAPERMAPFYCPYCGGEDLRPQEEHGVWGCRSCRRAFTLRFLGLWQEVPA